ncbi:MAG: FAD-dependent monooxygenase [Cyanobium sp. M30B3]|nr:MAG: FAD-dependent monooxygenase [Cyanobium sp. M30B3]
MLESPEHWEAVVVGAGPAGALAALQLARQGVRVLLVEKRTFPRWKVCGCCLNAQAQAVLAAAGAGALIDSQGGVPLRRLQLGHRGQRATLTLPDGRALSRERFDQALVQAAVDAGAHFRESTTARLGPADPEARTLTLQRHGSPQILAVRAQVVLVAAGLAHRCLPAGEGGAPVIQSHARIGAGCVLAAPEAPYPAGSIHMAIARQGYVGLVRREDGQLNLAAAFDRQALQTPAGPECGGAAAAARAVLSSAGFAIPAGLEQARWQLTAALTRRAPVVAGERFLVLGDAAGYVEPFTGEGMAWALTAGAAAAPVVLAGLAGWSPALERRWQRELQRRVGRRQRLCRGLALVLRQPGATALAFALSQRLPALAEGLVGQLNHVAIPSRPLTPCP